VYLIQSAMVPLDRVNDIVDAQVGAGTGAAESAAPGDQGPPPAMPVPADQTNSQVVDALVADLKAEVAQRHAALAAEVTMVHETQQAQQQELLARLAADRALRDLQQATLAFVAARLVRRELAQVQKLALKHERLPERLGTYYQRFVTESCAELQPLWHRMRPDGEGLLRTVLESWATQAQADCLHAIGNGGLETMAVGREAALVQRLWEGCHA
jgi:hypothetical protein